MKNLILYIILFLPFCAEKNEEKHVFMQNNYDIDVFDITLDTAIFSKNHYFDSATIYEYKFKNNTLRFEIKGKKSILIKGKDTLDLMLEDKIKIFINENTYNIDRYSVNSHLIDREISYYFLENQGLILTRHVSGSYSKLISINHKLNYLSEALLMY
jgi:hypothetical protein